MTEPYVYRGSHFRDPAPLNAFLARSPAEEPLEPDLPIVDPHHHLWDSPKRGCYLLPDFLADLAEGHNIVGTVFLECEAMYRAGGRESRRPVGEVEFVRGIRAMSASGRYGPTVICQAMVGYADLMLGSAVRETLEAEIEAGNGLLRGIRYCAPWDPNDDVGPYVAHYVPPGRLTDPAFREGFAELAPLGLSFDAWLYFHQLPDLIDLARAFPDTTMVANHCGGPIAVGPYASQRAEVIAAWRKHIAELARLPNTRIKLGGLGMLHFGFDFHLREAPARSDELAEAWRPYVEACIEAFGPKRAMFESNFPPDKQSCRYGTLWNAFKRIAAGASADVKRDLFSGTASEVYRLSA